MSKTILITGATDGIGLETAKRLGAEGHHLLIHGRSAEKLAGAEAAIIGAASIERYRADFARLEHVAGMADAITAKHNSLDVVINNAGVFKTATPIAPNGLDMRFVVNTLSPYLLAKRLLPIMSGNGRIVNLSSAAQAPVSIPAMQGGTPMADMDAYSQSKLAITMWTRAMAHSLPDGPVVVAVNPGSLLASKMVTEGFGVAGNDIQIGVDILHRAALSDEFTKASGQYFDNDSGRFAPPHPEGLDDAKCAAVTQAVEDLIADHHKAV